jgi:hypothetical protein
MFKKYEDLPKVSVSETWRSCSFVDDDSIHVVYDVVSSGKSISTFPSSLQEGMNFQRSVFITLSVSDAKAASLNPK